MICTRGTISDLTKKSILFLKVVGIAIAFTSGNDVSEENYEVGMRKNSIQNSSAMWENLCDHPTTSKETDEQLNCLKLSMVWRIAFAHTRKHFVCSGFQYKNYHVSNQITSEIYFWVITTHETQHPTCRTYHLPRALQKRWKKQYIYKYIIGTLSHILNKENGTDSWVYFRELGYQNKKQIQSA